MGYSTDFTRIIYLLLGHGKLLQTSVLVNAAPPQFPLKVFPSQVLLRVLCGFDAPASMQAAEQAPKSLHCESVPMKKD